MFNEDRPLCGVCNSNPAQYQYRNKDGSKKYRRRRLETGEKVFVCMGCHKRYYKSTTKAKWTYGRDKKGNARGDYLIHRKSYCENVDGRLGFVCKYDIQCEKQLTVDHIEENNNGVDDPNKNDPLNLQTLCANCHTFKSHLVATAHTALLEHMVTVDFQKKNVIISKKRIKDRVLKILKNGRNWDYSTGKQRKKIDNG